MASPRASCSPVRNAPDAPALRYLERWYVPHAELRSDWIALAAATRPGDQLREVICLTKGDRGAAAGDVFLGLFRDGAMVSEMHFVIID